MRVFVLALATTMFVAACGGLPGRDAAPPDTPLVSPDAPAAPEEAADGESDAARHIAFMREIAEQTYGEGTCAELLVATQLLFTAGFGAGALQFAEDEDEARESLLTFAYYMEEAATSLRTVAAAPEASDVAGDARAVADDFQTYADEVRSVAGDTSLSLAQMQERLGQFQEAREVPEGALDRVLEWFGEECAPETGG